MSLLSCFISLSILNVWHICVFVKLMLYLKLRLFTVYITHYARLILKKNELNSLLWKFLKSFEINKILLCGSMVFSLPPLWPEFPLSRLVMPPSVARPFSAVTWRISEVSPVMITFYSYTMVYSLGPYCAHVVLRAFTFQPPFKDRFVFRIDFRVKLEHQIVKDISRVMEICTQWFKYRFSCTGFIKKK